MRRREEGGGRREEGGGRREEGGGRREGRRRVRREGGGRRGRRWSTRQGSLPLVAVQVDVPVLLLAQFLQEVLVFR